jgi:hypothetical protein
MVSVMTLFGTLPAKASLAAAAAAAAEGHV